MAWILRLVKADAGGDDPGTDVMEIAKLGDLRDIANLGLSRDCLTFGGQAAAAKPG